jgi:hypothetical protein
MFASSRKSRLLGSVLAAALLAGAGGASTGEALADTPAATTVNTVTGIEHRSSGGLTTIMIRGSKAAKFSVYRLERPTRIVIDIAGADLATAVTGAHETSASIATNTWSVGAVSASELQDGGKVVRVVVTLARPGRYDVKAAGNDIIVAVTARDAAPGRRRRRRAHQPRAPRPRPPASGRPRPRPRARPPRPRPSRPGPRRTHCAPPPPPPSRTPSAPASPPSRPEPR